MPAAVSKTPAKRVLAETTNTRANIVASPHSTKKRKLDSSITNSRTPNGKLGSSQPKSQFETEVLEKLSQDINGLKHRNSENDQQWARPNLDDFDEHRDPLCFQQIDVEEGTLHGGKVAVKLFGVTEVRARRLPHCLNTTLISPSQTGHSVLLHVTDFLHYLYVAVPVGFQKDDCQAFQTYLETTLAQHQPAIHSVQMVMRENMYGFQGNQKSPYLKITVTDTKFINRLRTTIEGGNANWKGLWKTPDGNILTYDSIQYVLRFMIDTHVRRYGLLLYSLH
jgi:DNA polymerase delta subunit 1